MEEQDGAPRSALLDVDPTPIGRGDLVGPGGRKPEVSAGVRVLRRGELVQDPLFVDGRHRDERAADTRESE